MKLTVGLKISLNLRLAEIRAAGVTVAAALSPQRTQELYTIVFPAGLWTRRILDWYVPRGHKYTTRLAFFDVCGNYSEVCFGFRVFRNDKLWFDGDTIETDHGNGVVSKMMRMGHIGTFYSRDSIQDPSDSSNIIDFPSTFDPGEKISVEVIKNTGVNNAQISANLRITGYLYPQELAP